MNTGVSRANAWTFSTLLVAMAFLLTLAFSSAWWSLLVVPVFVLLMLLVWMAHHLAHHRDAGKSTKVLVALFFPAVSFILAGGISWLAGVPQGLKVWLYGDDILAAVGVPLLFIVVYGLALIWIFFGTPVAVWYAVQQNRLNESWIVCVIAIVLAFLSGGIGHLVHASTTQL